MELVVSTAVLAFIFGIVFLLFSYGLSGYAQLEARQGVQGDALKARIQLERDLSLTHFGSVGVVNRDVGGRERDILCLLGMSDWNDESRFENNGLPSWDRYIVFYATDDQESGRLMRAVLAPEPPTGLDYLRIGPVDLGLLGQIDQATVPGDLDMVERLQVVDGIQEFSCEPDEAHQVISVTLSGRRVGGRKSSEGVARTDEVFQAVFEFDPLNTSPRL